MQDPKNASELTKLRLCTERKPSKTDLMLTEELLQLDRDVDTVCFAGFTEEEIRLYHNLEERISSRILHHLQAETAIES